MIRRIHRYMAAAFLMSTMIGIHADSQTLYSIDHNITPHLWTLDTLTGSVATDIGGVSATGYTVAGARCLATDPTDGTLYAVLYAADIVLPANEGHLLVTLNPANAAGTPIVLLSQGIRDITFDAAGQLYGVSGGPNQSSIPDHLFAIDKATGSLTDLSPVGTTGTNPRNHALAFMPNRPGVLYHRYGMTGFETITTTPPHTRTEIGTNDLGMLISSPMVFDNAAGMFRTGENPGGAGVPYRWVTLLPDGVKTDTGFALPFALFGYAFDQEGTIGTGLVFADDFESGGTTNWTVGLD